MRRWFFMYGICSCTLCEQECFRNLVSQVVTLEVCIYLKEYFYFQQNMVVQEIKNKIKIKKVKRKISFTVKISWLAQSSKGLVRKTGDWLARLHNKYGWWCLLHFCKNIFCSVLSWMMGDLLRLSFQQVSTHRLQNIFWV